MTARFIKKQNKITHEFRRSDASHLWYKGGKLHRDDDLPAVIFGNGTQGWYRHGKLHRDDDLPAVIFGNGTQGWYRHGKLHRDDDLPACISSIGDLEWYQHGKLHRDNDLPAIIYDNYGEKCHQWYQYGKKHRDNDLPAVIDDYGAQYWFHNGVPVDHVAIMKRRLIVILILLYQRKVIRVPWDVIRCEIAKFL